MVPPLPAACCLCCCPAQVRRLAQQLMQRFNGAASCVDDGTEHPHRVSLSIRSDVLDDFLRRWGSGLAQAGVKVTWEHTRHRSGRGLPRCPCPL